MKHSNFLMQLSYELENCDSYSSYDEMYLYNSVISDYVDIPVERLLNAGSLLNKICDFSETKTIKKINKNDIPVDEIIESTCIEDKTEIEEIIEDIENEFANVNTIIYYKFKNSYNGYTEMDVEYAIELFNYTIKKIENKYLNSEYEFKFTILKSMIDDKIQSINLILNKE